MKKVIFLTLILMTAGSLFADVWTDSTITGNTTWYRNNTSGDGVYIIDLERDSLIVESGATLTIEPGVTVKFHNDAYLAVYGTLVAEGTGSDSIFFTVDDATGSVTEWGGIKLRGSSTANKLIYCRIEQADADASSPYLPLYNKNGGGIFCDIEIDGQTEIKHCVITGNRAVQSGGGIYCRGGASPVIEYNTIYNNSANNSGGGIGVSGIPGYVAQPLINNNLIYGNTATMIGGGGISVLGNSNASLYNNMIYNNAATNGSGGGLLVIGIANAVAVRNSVIRGNSAGSNNQVGGSADVQYSNIEGGFAGTGNISADPLFADPDNYDFHYEANSPLVDAGSNSGAPALDFDGNARPFDGDRNGTATVDIGMYEYQNTSPVIISEAVLSATEETAYSYQLTAEDPDVDDVLTFSLVEAPSFLGIDAETGLITGTPMTDADGGDHTVTVQAADLNNATGQQTFTLSVATINDALAVADIPDQSIDEGESFATINLDEFVTDEETPDAEISWTYSGNTELNVLIGTNRVATISAPNADWYGAETITFTATDAGGLQAGNEARFTIANVNDAPVITGFEDQSTPEGEAFDTVVLDNVVNDVDHTDSELTWTYSGNSAFSIEIDANRELTITPIDENFNGSETIRFKVSDPEGLADSADVLFTVTPVNDTPVVSDIADQTIDEGANFTVINLDDYVSDVDNTDADIAWTYSGSSDLLVTIDENRVATVITPNADWYGSETITFTATDPGNLSSSDEVVFSVNNVNDQPLAVNDTVSTEEEQALIVQVLLNDSDIDEDALEVLSATDPANGSATVQNGTTILYTPDTDFTGSDNFIYTVSDMNGGESSATVFVTVNPVNDAPVVSDIPDQTIDEGGSFTVINLDDYVSDVDNADADLAWTYSGNTDLILTIDENRIATITIPDIDWNGSETITFTATDPGDLFASDEVVFTVNNINDNPLASSDTVTTDEDQALTVQVLLNDSDIDEDVLEVVSATDPANGSVIVQDGSTVLYTPDADFSGSDSFNYTIRDNNGGESFAAVYVTVNPVNDAPVVSDIPDQTIDEGGSFTVINLDDYVGDVDNADSLLNWTYSGNTDLNVTIDENRAAVITIPNPDWFGAETITFTATDPGELLGSGEVVFTVNNVNDVPVAVNDTSTTSEDNAVSISVLANDSDIDQDALQVSEVTVPANGKTEIQDGTTVLYTPNANFFGADTFRYSVTDNKGGETMALVTVNVTAVNDPPVLSGFEDQNVQEGQSFASFDLDTLVTDVDNADADLVWIFSGNVELEVTIDEHNVVSVVAPSEDWNGSETVRFKVSDPMGLDDSTDVIFTITGINDPPVVSVIDNQTEEEGSNFMPVVLDNFVEDVDDGDATLVWSASGYSELSVEIDENRVATISAPDENWNGSETIWFKVTDPAGASDSVSAAFTWTPVNDPPVLSQIPDQTIDEGGVFMAVDLNDYVSDPDNADSTLSWTWSGQNEMLVSVDTNHIAVFTVPGEDWNGSETITFRVEDTEALSDSVQVVLTVAAVNDPPVIAAELPVLSLAEDDSLVYALSNWFEFVTDIDNPDSALFYFAYDGKHVSVVPKDPSALPKDNYYTFKPGKDWFGSDTLALIVHDGSLDDTSAFFIRVTPVNDPPVISGLPESVIFANDTTFEISLAGAASDIDSDSLSWSFSVSNDSVYFEFHPESSNLTLSAPGFEGDLELICTVTDDSLAAASDTIKVKVDIPTAVEGLLAEGIPTKFELYQNYPNPFNPLTTIKFAVPKTGKLKIDLFNIVGQKVLTLFEGEKKPGYHTITFNASGLSSGMYFYQIQADGFRSVKKMILMK